MPDETLDVVIVFAHDPHTDGPDLDRIGSIETYPRAQARRMVESGEARWPQDPRNVDDGYMGSPDQSATGPDDMPDGSGEAKTLERMNKTDLRGMLPDATLADLGTNPTRLELLAAVRRTQSQPQAEPEPATGDK